MKKVMAQNILRTKLYAAKSVSTVQFPPGIPGNTQPFVTASQKETCHLLPPVLSENQEYLLGIPGSQKPDNTFVCQGLLSCLLCNGTKINMKQINAISYNILVPTKIPAIKRVLFTQN